MGHLRVVVVATFSDHDAMVEFLQNGTRYVEESCSETLAWEWYLGPGEGRVTF